MIPRRLLIAIVLLVVAASTLGLYVWHLARRARIPGSAATADTRPIAPPVAGPATQIVLFAASDEDGMLHRQEVSIALPEEPAKRTREILRALLSQYQEHTSAHRLGAGADINDLYLVSGGLAVVDVNATLADTHPSGVLAEELTLASIAQTLAYNTPGITRIKLVVDGKERVTLAGHASLSESYAVAGAARLVKPTPGKAQSVPAGVPGGVQSSSFRGQAAPGAL